MKFDNIIANQEIADFYFQNHPDSAKHLLTDFEHTIAIDNFFNAFDRVFRQHYANASTADIDYFIDSQIYGL